MEAAWAAARKKGSYLSAQYHRLAAWRGAKRAILVTIYHLLCHGTTYQDLGANYYDERSRLATVRRAVRRIERLGYKVTLEAA